MAWYFEGGITGPDLRSERNGEDARVFLYGHVLSFRELEDCKVWEKDDYICYEVDRLIYSDLDDHTEQWLQANPDVLYDDALRQRVQNV